MAKRSDANPMPQKQDAAGAEARFSFDRMAVERFRQAFPRARWSDERKSWFVPGKTATRRIERWLAQEAEMLAVHGDSKGRDAFAFDPISSPYLEMSEDLRVRTPYSKTILEELRAVPWASWDDELRAWRVPFRSFEELRRRWARIEKAAQHAEPEERKRQREVARQTEAYKAAQLGMPNVAVIAIHCQLKIYRLLAGQLRQSNTASSFSSKCPANSLSRLC